jgi:REP element-mobilizing transposase RayT
MSASRHFLFPDCQAGVFHVVSRLVGRAYYLEEDNGREEFVKMMRAYEDVCGVEVLTYCVMSNHFHLLVRVPHRPEGFEVPLEVVVARLERALGNTGAAELRKQLEFWNTTKNTSAIEEWRQRQVARMFSLSEFMKRLKFRFTRWYNRKHGRKGVLWESRYTSVIVEEEERALRTMAAYIDLNPVRAGMVEDPADYRWSGYAEAMAGKLRSRRGLVRIIGQMAWPRATSASANPWGDDPFPPGVDTRALVFYRAILGGQGAARKREDGTLVRRGLSEKVQKQLTTATERRVRSEVLMRRVAQFTRGVLFGSRDFIDGWFEANRESVKGRSRTERKRGSRSLGKPALRGLYSLRAPRA